MPNSRGKGEAAYIGAERTWFWYQTKLDSTSRDATTPWM